MNARGFYESERELDMGYDAVYVDGMGLNLLFLR